MIAATEAVRRELKNPTTILSFFVGMSILFLINIMTVCDCNDDEGPSFFFYDMDRYYIFLFSTLPFAAERASLFPGRIFFGHKYKKWIYLPSRK